MNRLVGERELKVNDKVYVLRPSFGAFVEIESRCGKSVIEIFEAFAAGRIRATDITLILHALVRAGARTGEAIPTTDEIGEAVLKNGISGLGVIAFECLNNALTPPADASVVEKKS